MNVKNRAFRLIFMIILGISRLLQFTIAESGFYFGSGVDLADVDR